MEFSTLKEIRTEDEQTTLIFSDDLILVTSVPTDHLVMVDMFKDEVMEILDEFEIVYSEE